MAITKEKKASLVQGYVDLLDDSYAVVMIQLLGLTVAEVTDLRTKIREAGGNPPTTITRHSAPIPAASSTAASNRIGTHAAGRS